MVTGESYSAEVILSSKQQAEIIKPIFHQNANPFALRFRIGYGPECEGFALLIPTCWYPALRTQQEYQSTQRETQRKLVKYNLCWAISHWHRIGHVDFMLFVSILMAFGSQRKHVFWWNMGFSVLFHKWYSSLH